MSVRSAESVTVVFTTRVFSTGVATDADSLPTGTLYLNGIANGAAVTVTHITTGVYSAQVVLPILAISDWVEIRIAATVSGVTDTDVIWRDTKDILLDTLGQVTINNATVNAVFSPIGVLPVNVIQWLGAPVIPTNTAGLPIVQSVLTTTSVAVPTTVAALQAALAAAENAAAGTTPGTIFPVIPQR